MVHPLTEAELKALAPDLLARFVRIAELLESFGPQHVGLPHIRPLENKLWEMRMTGGFIMKTLKTLKRELLTDPAVQMAYDGQGAEFSIVRELIAARMRAGLTQGQIAERMGTTQSVIARLEGGKRAPSMSTVARYAQAAGCRAVFKLEPLAG